jgi:hypothetical protein
MWIECAKMSENEKRVFVGGASFVEQTVRKKSARKESECACVEGRRTA